MAEIKFEGTGATNKEHRLVRLPRCEAGRRRKFYLTEEV
jgi:hypothetical protein